MMLERQRQGSGCWQVDGQEARLLRQAAQELQAEGLNVA
jgi:hypothetical protein